MVEIKEGAKADSEIVTTAEGEQEISTQSENPTIKIRKDSQLRKLIAYAITRVENGDTVTVVAYGRCLPRAITLVAIVRERVGHVNQVSSLVNAEGDEEEGRGAGRITTGISIVISRSALDSSDPGYQRGKPRGCDSFYFISKSNFRQLTCRRTISGGAHEEGGLLEATSRQDEERNQA